MTLGQRVAQKRKELGLSQEGLGEQLGVWDKWSVRVLFALCGIMLALLVGVNTKVKEMEQEYAYLRGDVDSQVSSITSRLRAALEDQNEPLLEWDVDHEIDPRANTVTFQVRAVLKEYTEGMELRLAAQSGGEVVEAPIPLDPGLPLTGQVTCPLSDDISLYMVLSSDGVQRPRYLGSYAGLYSESLPKLVVVEPLAPVNGVIPANGAYLQVRKDGELIQDPSILQVGLFQDRKLVAWYEYGTVTQQGYLTIETLSGWRPSQDIPLEPGHQYCHAAVYTDEYGRQFVYPSSPIAYPPGDGSDQPSREYEISHDPASWEF